MTDARVGQPLFFAKSLSAAQVARLVAGIEEALDVDVVEFTGDAGGDVMRELGVPLLAGMDEIDVAEASFSIGVSATLDGAVAPTRSVPNRACSDSPFPRS